MKINELLIVGTTTFSSNKSGESKEYNVLQCCHFDSYNKIKAESIFTSADVVKQFTVPGVYEPQTLVTGQIISIKLVQPIKF